MARSPLEFDIRVSSAKKKKSRARGTSGATAHAGRQCDWPDCKQDGGYRAPRSRERLSEYYWFCLEHVREYNNNWDFYSGMEPEEIAASREKDKLWGRNTWKMNGKAGAMDSGSTVHAEGQAWQRFGFSDPHEVLGENATINPGSSPLDMQREVRRRMLPKADLKALEELGLDEMATFEDIRVRYTEMVKVLHPDMNGGDRSEEERLKSVIWAWSHLKSSASFKS